MGNSKVVGHCHVCGNYGPLSEEHVPPKRAFNDMPFVEIGFTERLSLGPDDVPDGRTARGHSLPVAVHAMQNISAAGMPEHSSSGVTKACSSWRNLAGIHAWSTLYDIFPLRIVKQLAVMFMAMNSDRFRLNDSVKELVRS